jgi:hypothetical protein
MLNWPLHVTRICPICEERLADPDGFCDACIKRIESPEASDCGPGICDCEDWGDDDVPTL